MTTRNPRPTKLAAALETAYTQVIRVDGGERDVVKYMKDALRQHREMEVVYQAVLDHPATAGLVWSMAYDAREHVRQQIRADVEWLNARGEKGQA